MIYSTSARVGGPVEEAQPRRRPPRALLARRRAPRCSCRRPAAIDRAQPRLRHRARRRWHLAPARRAAPAAARCGRSTDLGSTNGVLLNGAEIRGAQELARGRPSRARLHRDHLRAWMNTLEPVSVALKFGFLAVLYLFLLWVARSARRDLGAGARMQAAQDPQPRRRPTRRACTRRPRRAAWTSRTARPDWSSSARPATIRDDLRPRR